MTTAVQTKQEAILERFVAVYCRENHAPADSGLCEECRDLLAYAEQRLARCPLDPKPKCKDCRIHCYKPEYRRKIQQVMKFAGLYFVKRGRLDWLVKYFLS